MNQPTTPNPTTDALQGTWTELSNDLFTHHPLLASATLLITWRDDVRQPGPRAFMEFSPETKSSMVAQISVLYNLLRTAEALIKQLQLQHMQLVEIDNDLARAITAKQAELARLGASGASGDRSGAAAPGVDAGAKPA